MWGKGLKNISTSFDGLDPGLRLRIRIFAFKLLIIIPVSVALATHLGHPLLGTLSFFCFWHGFFAGAAAWFRGQKHGAGMLTAWDEMAAFLAVGIALRVVGAIMA
jgi:hypothetical protein